MKSLSVVGGMLVFLFLAHGAAHAQSGIAKGKVVDEQERPVAGVTVELEFQGGFDRTYEAKTNKKGEYTQIVTAGRYRITASKEDYQGAFIEQGIQPGAPTRLPAIQIVSRAAAIEAAIEKDEILGPFKKAALQRNLWVRIGFFG